MMQTVKNLVGKYETVETPKGTLLIAFFIGLALLFAGGLALTTAFLPLLAPVMGFGLIASLMGGVSFIVVLALTEK